MIDDLFDRFWSVYPRKVAKGTAKRAWDKTFKGMERTEAEALTNQITLAIEAQQRYRRHAEEHKEFMPDWKHPATWINGQCWLDEIPSHAELTAKHQEKICAEEGCETPVHGPHFTLCTYHLSTSGDNFEQVRDFYRRNGLGRKPEESRDEWLARLKATAKQYLSRMKYL